MTESTNVLASLSEALADTVVRAAESTLAVYARRRLPASGIAWAPGVVVTADHVLEREDEIQLGLPDGTTAAATVAGRDAGADIAVLRTSATLVPVTRGPVPRVGNIVVAVGRPGSDGPMATMGGVHALGGPWRTGRGTRIGGYIRSGVAFLPGFSGGPLVDAAGAAVGLNTSHLGRGAGLTLPTADVAVIAELLLTHGRVGRGYLGISSQPVRLAEAAAAHAAGRQSGLLITGVEPGTPADAAGFFVGDILVALGGEAIAEPGDLQAALGPDSIGRASEALVLRGGAPLTLAVTVGERH